MVLRSDVICKKMTLRMICFIASGALFLVGCNDTSKKSLNNNSLQQADLSVFEGCYTVSSDEPAQIKVSQQDGAWVMQMKEPAKAKRVWDTPEKLEVVDKSELPKFFSIDADNVDAIIGRPDRVMVLAHVKSVYANIDPLLDSEYLSFIYRGANTIYRVDCDEINTDILANPHAKIIIDNVDESKK